MQEKSLIKQNILQYIRYKGISKYQFYKETGITRGVLDQNNGLSEDNTARFIDYCKDVNIEWLLTGKGDMLKTESMENVAHSIPPNEQHEKQHIDMEETQLLRDMIAMLKTSNDNLQKDKESQQKIIEMLQKQIDRIQTQNEELQAENKSLRETAKRNKTAGAA